MYLKKTSIMPSLDALDLLTFFAFCASVPLFVPVLDVWRAMLPPLVVDGSSLPTVMFSSALPLSAMFTSLAFLFVCLLKTAHARVSRTVMILALVCYGGGYGLLALWSARVLVGPMVGAISGLMVGFGAAVLCLVWVSGLRVLEFRRALLITWIAASCLFGGTLILSLVDPAIARVALTAAAWVAVMGAARFYFRAEAESDRAQRGSNWWDVFGHLDLSVVEGTADFKTPFARVLFVVVMPFAMLLLFVADNDLARQLDWPAAPLGVAGALAVLMMIVLVRLKTDQALINFSYRFFLPMVAFAVFAVSSFFEGSAQHTAMIIGSFSFCTVYALVMSAMFVTMAGRMRSLALPAAGIMIIVGCLVCLLSSSHVDPSVLGAYQYPVLIILLVVLAAAFMITPSSRLWRVLFEGIDAAESSASDKQEGYAQRCSALAASYSLTARESEILLLLGRGHTASYVAELLTVAESTVRSHRKNIYRKLGVSSREDLFKLLDFAGEEEGGAAASEALRGTSPFLTREN